MALQVWLPLNGNLQNQGVSRATFTSVGTWSYGVGKVTSKCMTSPNPTSSSATSYIYTTSTFKYIKNFSVSVWVKLPSANLSYSSYIATEGRADGTNYGWGLNGNATSLTARFGNSSNTKSRLTANTWHLATFTVDNSSKCSFYVDGVLNGRFTPSTLPTYAEDNGIGIGLFRYASGNIYQWNGSINDFRLYDHCLSVKEVKNLAKGLMLHYKLSRSGANYLIGSSIYLSATQTKSSKDGYQSYPIYANSLSAGTYIYSIEVTKGTLSNGHTTTGVDYTKGYWSLWLYTDSTTYSSSDYSHFSSATCFSSSNLLGRIGNTYYWKISITSAKPNCAVRINVYSDGTNNATINFGKIKLESYTKDFPTPWIPNSADTMYNQLGLNLNIEDDTSGYGNNGTRTNITTWNTDTARYLSSMTFNGSNGYIYLPKDSARPKDAITISVWAYMSDWSTYNSRLCSCTEGGGWNFEPYSSKICFLIGTGTSSNTYKYISSTKTLAQLGSGWHHFVGTYDGLIGNIYIDGILDGTLTAYTTTTPIFYANNYTFIGAEAGGNTTSPAGNYFNGRISDFRIYSTALSADDVKELYNVGASIDKNGNMYCYELVES